MTVSFTRVRIAGALAAILALAACTDCTPPAFQAQAQAKPGGDPYANVELKSPPAKVSSA